MVLPEGIPFVLEAVVADRRGIDQHLALARVTDQGVCYIAGGQQPAVDDFFLVGRRPEPENRGSRQVDDRVVGGQLLLPASSLGRIRGEIGDASILIRLARPSTDQGQAVARSEEMSPQGAADKAGTAGNADAHGSPPW